MTRRILLASIPLALLADQEVRIVAGPLRGVVGKLRGATGDRAKVELGLLRGSMLILVRWSDMEMA